MRLLRKLRRGDTSMTKKQIERLHRECSEFGVDFPDRFFAWVQEVRVIIRWSKSKDKPSHELVVRKLKNVGCFDKPTAPKLNFDWL